MNPAKTVWSALRGDSQNTTPFTTYELFLTQSFEERNMRNRGLCLLRPQNSYYIDFPTRKTISYRQEGREFTKTVFDTPYGELSTLSKKLDNSTSNWTLEHIFKSPDDYKKTRWLIESAAVVPDYERVSKIVQTCGDDYIIRDNLPLEPLQNLISSFYMDMTDFCMEWMDNRDEIMKLYDAFLSLNRQTYPIVANGPLRLANYGGNVVPQIIGPEVFEKLYMPHYEEAAEYLHKTGKLIGSHFDSDNTPIMDLIAKTHLDYIEAYDPGISPSVGAAIKCFGDKAIWINWPSAWHLCSREEAAKKTAELITETNGFPKFIIAITEDIPPDRQFSVMHGILDGIEAYHSH